VGEVVGEAEKYHGVDQQVQRLSHFLLISVISYFLYPTHFFTLPLYQVIGSSTGHSATQSSVLGDSFASIIKDVIRSFEDDPTHRELRADASEAEWRPPTVAQENVQSVVAQQDVSKQPTTYVRRPKKRKQVCVCTNYNFSNSFSFSVIH
jgi:hypothetical protein